MPIRRAPFRGLISFQSSAYEEIGIAGKEGMADGVIRAATNITDHPEPGQTERLNA
jgi:hypothetical protein